MTDPTKPTRRGFLALGAGAVLAGCVGGSDGGRPNDSTTMRSSGSASRSSSTTTEPGGEPTTTTAPTTGDAGRRDTATELVRIDSARSQPQATASITATNPTDGSATITVWNDAETARRMGVAITDRDAGTSVLRRTYRLGPDAYAEIEVTKPGTYTLDVGTDGDEPTTIDFVVDTCNSLGVNVAVRRDGTVNSTQVSTAVGCATVAVTDTVGQ